MLKLNDSLTDGSFIRFEVEELNVTCDNNAIYVYSSISEISGQKRLLNVICKDENFIDNFRESKTGELAIYFHKTNLKEGFNGIITIFSCQLNTCHSPFICENNKCTCPANRRGINCEIDSNLNITSILPSKPNSIIVEELFNTLTVNKNLNHLKKTLPRFGHTVNADRRGYLWIFAGYSLSNGALNDIRQFDTKNHTWMQTTVDGSDSKMPTGRFFHAAEINKQTIFVYGGISNDFKILGDFWMFNTLEQRWSEIEVTSKDSPTPLAGHTMTIVKIDEKEKIFIIGGYKNSTNSLDSSETPLISHHASHQSVYEFDIEEKLWRRLNTTGSSPAVIFGHSTSYHAASHVIYVHGGYQWINGSVVMSNRLYSLRKSTDGSWMWNFLPVFNELNRPEENLPRARFLHSSIAFQNFMVIYSGEFLSFIDF